MVVYLDCNATTPMEPEVLSEVIRFMSEEFGNAGSRTHQYGQRAKKATQHAREQVALVVASKRDEVVFTSGATESNNLALLGLAPYGQETGRRHIISSKIEHKAVLEPLERLQEQGFEVTLLSPTSGGWIDPDDLSRHLRPDTLLVSLMHVNNETGIIQPLDEMSARLEGHDTFLHVDAAQSFGKLIEPLRDKRIDLVSISGHKIYGPKGIGALIVRRRGYTKPPLTPLMVGGGQERGLRPGTLPVQLVVGLGKAAELALAHHTERREACESFREELITELEPLGPHWVGDNARRLYNTASLRFPGVDSEAIMVQIKGLVALSNGSACTSSNYDPSHVMLAMGLGKNEAQEVVRLSWYHTTTQPDWEAVRKAIQRLRM
ncbi:MAG: cysteine desulfurase DndA [Myxococcota bacterium]